MNVKVKYSSLRPLEGKTIIVTNKKVEGFKDGPLSSLYQTESPKKHSLQQYISQTKAEGTSTRSEFLENLYNGFIQMYSEGNEYPESYLKMSESDFKWDLYTEHGLGNEQWVILGQKTHCSALIKRMGTIFLLMVIWEEQKKSGGGFLR